MKIAALCVLAVAVVATVAEDSAKTTIPVSTTTSEPSHINSTTTPEPITSTAAPNTTVAPTTSTAAPNTTVAPPTTSTAAPNTTTAAPTTPAPTTPAPTTPVPTTPAPVTTPAPTPVPASGNWTVSNGSVICIMIQTELSVDVSYPQAANKTNTVSIKVPGSAKADGTCGVDKQSISISWGTSQIGMDFSKNGSLYYLSHISFHVIADNKTFPNISESLLNKPMDLLSSSSEFKTAVNQSYRCMSEESLPLHSSTNDTSAVLRITKVQLQAFYGKAHAEFGDAQDCELVTPDIVPIAVGCALAALVAVVLIAYLVGRRRSQALGYLSIFLD